MTTKACLRGIICLVFAVLLGFGFSTGSAFLKGGSNKAAIAFELKKDPPVNPSTLIAVGHSEVKHYLVSVTSESQRVIALGHRSALEDWLRQGTSAAPASQTPSDEKTIDQVQKNILVLKGIPESLLIPMMSSFNTALGVNCNFCHVGNAFDKDDKPEKGTARRMIQMTMEINKQGFNGRTQVSCFTCHRGKNSPVGIATLPLVFNPPPAGGDTARPARPTPPTADDIIAKYLAAVGGASALSNQKTRVSKGVQTSPNGTQTQIEVDQTSANKYSEIVAPTAGGGGMTLLFDGTNGWARSARGNSPLDSVQLDHVRRIAEFNLPLKVAELYPKMRIVGRDKIGDRDVWIGISQFLPNQTARLYFDTETGLLLRLVLLVETPVGRIPGQIDFSDYRDVDGAKLPFTMTLSGIDARSGWTRKFTEIKSNVTVPDSVFNAPEPPPAKP